MIASCHRWTLWGVALLLVAATPVTARRIGGGSVPLRVTIEGTLSAEGRQDGPLERLSVGYHGKIYRLVACEVKVLDPGPLAAQVLRAVAPYDPNLQLQGPPKMMAPLVDAKPGARVVMRGAFRASSRSFLVSALEVTPASASP